MKKAAHKTLDKQASLCRYHIEATHVARTATGIATGTDIKTKDGTRLLE